VRVFLDANVISAAAHWPQGRARALFRLAAAGRCKLVASPHAIQEARRNLILKSPRGAEALDALLERVEKVAEAGPRTVESAAGHGLQDSDAPILAAAIVAGTDFMVTGDRTHFGHLFGSEVGGVRVVSLAEALEAILAV
jgi:predicted nucleic acid-binding protein